MAQIEVEIRGEVEDYNKTLAELKKKAKFIEEKNRLTLAYFKGDLAKDVREVKDEKVDLRIRITNKKPEIIMKYGGWGAKDQRKEISIPISIEDFDEAVDLLKHLGWTKCLIAPYKTLVFDYKGIEFALVTQSGKHKYFEVEKIAKNEKDVKSMHKEIEDACKEFNLVPHTQEEFYDRLNRMNKDLIIADFNKDDWKEIKKKFKEFF